MNVGKKNSLEIYISEKCFVCSETPNVIEKIRDKFPSLNVNVIDISIDQNEIPDSVFSVPTYTFNGRTISLGNPTEEFFDRLENLLRK